MRGRLLLACASLLASLVACEIALRVLFVAPVPLAAAYPMGIRIAGGEVRVRQREYDTRHRYDRFGFRDDEFPVARGPNEYRVLVLGDSFAEGLGVEAAERFSSLLRESLPPLVDGRHVVVLNAGQMGTGPRDYANNVADFGVALRPDLVIVTIYAGNDLFLGAQMARWQRPVREALPAAALEDDRSWQDAMTLGYVRRGVAGHLVRRLRGVDLWSLLLGAPLDEARVLALLAPGHVSAAELRMATRDMDAGLVADFMAGRINPAELFEAIGERVARIRHERPSKVACARYADVRGVARLQRRLGDLLATRGARLLVVVIPDVHEVMPAAHRAFLRRLAVVPNVRMRTAAGLRRKLLALLVRDHLPVVDPTAALVAAPSPAYHVMDGHLTAEGHRIVAQAITRAVAGAVD